MKCSLAAFQRTQIFRNDYDDGCFTDLKRLSVGEDV